MTSGEFGKKYPTSSCLEFDAVCQFSWSESNTAVDCKRSVVVVSHPGTFVTSSTQEPHLRRLVSSRRNIENAMQVLPRFDEVICTNKSLARTCNRKLRKGVLRHFGVDTDIFQHVGGFDPSTRWGACWISQDSPVKGIEYARQIDNLEMTVSDPHSNPHPPIDVAGIYNKSIDYVCTSFGEGGPMTIPEAMACGCNIHTTNVGIVPDIDPNISIGRVYRDPQHLVDEYRVPSDPVEGIPSESNRQYAVENWSWEKQSKEWIDAILG